MLTNVRITKKPKNTLLALESEPLSLDNKNSMEKVQTPLNAGIPNSSINNCNSGNISLVFFGSAFIFRISLISFISFPISATVFVESSIEALIKGA